MSGARFALVLAWRQSRAARLRLALLAAAVSAGVAALVSIHAFTENLQDSVRTQARALLGADVALGSGVAFSPRADALLAELQTAAGATGVSRVTSFGAMAWAARTASTRLVQVQAVDGGWPFFGTVRTDPEDAWARLRTEDGAVVDEALVAALGVQRGDVLALGEARFPITGVVREFPGDVGMRSALGPRVFIPASRAAATGLLIFGSRARHEAFLTLPAGTDAERLAARFRPRLAPERVNIRTAGEDERSLNGALGRLTSYLGLLGFMALLLGGVGVASSVRAFLRRQLDTIAVLRCLGAPASLIFGAYLAQSALMGLAGSVVGAALGVLMQRLLPRALHDFLPVDVVFATSWRAIGSGLLVGVGVSLLAALLPLLAIRRVSPLLVLRRDVETAGGGRDRVWIAVALGAVLAVVGLAILESGRVSVGLGFSAVVAVALLVLWLCARLAVAAARSAMGGRGPYPWRQAVANLHRPANQTTAVVLALGFGAFLLATIVVVQRNLLGELQVSDEGPRPNVVLFDVQADQRAAVAALLQQRGAVPGPLVPIVPMRLVSVKGVVAAARMAPGDPGSDLRDGWAFRREYRSSYRDALGDSETVAAGTPWAPGSWHGRGAAGATVPVSLEEGLARELGVRVGDPIVWDVQGLRVSTRVAVLRTVRWARFEPNFFVVFPEGPIDAAPQTFVTLTRLPTAAARAALQRAIVERFPNVSVLDLSQVQQTIEGVLARVALAVRFMALFSLAAGATVLVGALAGTRAERLRDAALLKALGATRAQVLGIAAAEALLLGALAALCGVSLSLASGWAASRYLFETSFHAPGAELLAVAAAVVALTVAIGVGQAVALFRQPAMEALRAE